MVMPRQAAWATDEECPSCAAEMVLIDDGLPVVLVECQSCGHRETRDTASHTTLGGDNW
jgi:uncharacterized Zn finger protein